MSEYANVETDVGEYGDTAIPVKIIKQSLNNLIIPTEHHPPVIQGSGQVNFNFHREAGWFLDIRRLSCASFTAGSVTVYKNVIDDSAIVVVFPQAGVFTFGRGEVMVRHGDTLIFVASNITGNVTPAIYGTQVNNEVFTDYMM